jgi:ribonuclease HI
MYELYFDGACQPNPGKAAYGWVLQQDGEQIATGAAFIKQKTTNNVAEYVSLTLGLKAALDRGIEELRVYGDSQLVIKQVHGENKVKAEHLVAHRDRVRTLMSRFTDCTLEWIPREKNSPADGLTRVLYAEAGIKLRY